MTKKKATSDDFKKTEQQLREQVVRMTEAIPADESTATLAIALVTTMGERSDKEKVMLLSTVLVAALKMLAEQNGEPTP